MIIAAVRRRAVVSQKHLKRNPSLGGVPEISALVQRITVTDLLQFLSSATLVLGWFCFNQNYGAKKKCYQENIEKSGIKPSGVIAIKN